MCIERLESRGGGGRNTGLRAAARPRRKRRRKPEGPARDVVAVLRRHPAELRASRAAARRSKKTKSLRWPMHHTCDGVTSHFTSFVRGNFLYLYETLTGSALRTFARENLHRGLTTYDATRWTPRG